MICIGENKSILCRGDFRPAQLYKGNKKIAGYIVEKFEGNGSVTLENCYNDKVYDMQTDENVQSITVRGKNYFDVNKTPFSNSTTTPYNNGLTAKKTENARFGNKIPISLPINKKIYVTMDVVASEINGTSKQVTMGFYNSGDTRVGYVNVSRSIGHKSYSITLEKEISHILFYFQNEQNEVGDYVTMDNIMLRCEGSDVYEQYIKPQTVPFENGDPTKDIPTFRGTTVIEAEATIRGKYRKQEVE